MARRGKGPERVIAGVVAVVYLVACCSVVVRAGLSAGPFDFGPIYGFSCALTGWMDYPFGWLANPLLWAGVIQLACGRSGAASVCGLLAVVPVVQWSLAWDRQGLWLALRAGYYMWVAAVGVLAVGSSFLWFFRVTGRQGTPNQALQPTGAATSVSGSV